jgi:CheY-like chemotaxis protein
MDHLPVILVVEDDAATLTLLGALVHRQHYQAILVDDGREALRRLGAQRFDALLLDLLLPEVNGFELLRHIKCTIPDLLPRTVVMTAASPATISGCEELRLVQRLIRKPFEVADVNDAIQACVGHPPEEKMRIDSRARERKQQ